MESVTKKISDFVDADFDKSALPGLMDFIRIPNLSKNFDPEWNSNGLLEKAAKHVKSWIEAQNIKGLNIEYIKNDDLSPLLFIEVAGTDKDAGTVLMYGHFDKQPHMVGWSEGLGPVDPVIKDGKLYGRGSNDDGYSIFSAITAIKACQTNGLAHPRVVFLMEGDEESGSTHINTYIERVKDKIGTPSMIFILDAGCLNYEQFWLVTSLRGNIKPRLNVKIINEGVHSGDASGIVPDTFRIIRELLGRLEDPKTGDIIKELQVNIPPNRYQEGYETSKVMGDALFQKFPWLDKSKQQGVSTDNFQLYLNRHWRPTLTVIGQDGLPPCEKAGNVLRPETTISLSIRLPPTLNADKAFDSVKEILEKNPPYGAKVELLKGNNNHGWSAPDFADYLSNALKDASKSYFGKPLMATGEGGSIPFVNKLNIRYPKAQFLVCGVAGPGANAHGPNEMLNIPYTKQFTKCIAYILSQSAEHIKGNQ
mmetsp:Transcript_24422/g.21611  ORF Transcript_24422/g.21611 Transcript_24422/m.21611 type:complete len:479 (+) Transcript_24422:68-1504(+)